MLRSMGSGIERLSPAGKLRAAGKLIPGEIDKLAVGP
jgi:hypothetical protein